MRPKRIVNEVHDRLREMVFANELRPGQKLRDRELADLLGVSRTPVREALTRLEQAGLVSTRNGTGHFVSEIDSKQITDLYDLRELLEVHAIRLAADRATPDDLDELATVLTGLESYRHTPDKRNEEILVGLKVHEIVARASGNAFLFETVQRLLERMRMFIWIESLYADHAAAEATREEHKAYLALIKRREVDEAELVVRRHIRTAKQHILQIITAREIFYRPSPFVSGPSQERKAST